MLVSALHRQNPLTSGPYSLCNTLSNATGIVADGSSNLYIAESGSNRILKYVPSSNNTGTLTVFAGSGSAGSNNANGASATFSYPLWLAIDSNSNLYVADYSNNLIRKIDASANVTTVSMITIGPRQVAVNPAGTIVMTIDRSLYLHLYSNGTDYGAPLGYSTYPATGAIAVDTNNVLYYAPAGTVSQPTHPTNVTSLYNFSLGTPVTYVLSNLSNFTVSNYSGGYGIQISVPSGSYTYGTGDIATFSGFTGAFIGYNGQSAPILTMINSSNFLAQYTPIFAYPSGTPNSAGTITFSNVSTTVTSNYSNFSSILLTTSNGYGTFYTTTPPSPAWPVGSNTPTNYVLTASGFTGIFSVYNGIQLGSATTPQSLVVSNSGYSTVTIYIPTSTSGGAYNTFSNSWAVGTPNAGAYIAYNGVSNSNIYNIARSSNQGASAQVVFTFSFTTNTNFDGSATISNIVFGGFTGSFSNPTPSSLGNYNGIQFFSNGTTAAGNGTSFPNALSNYSNSTTSPTLFYFSCSVGTYTGPQTGTPNTGGQVSIVHLPITSNVVTLDGTSYGTTLSNIVPYRGNVTSSNILYGTSIYGNTGYAINGTTAVTAYTTNVPSGITNFVVKNPLGAEVFATSTSGQLVSYSNIY